jgi:HlyD family secretion protein
MPDLSRWRDRLRWLARSRGVRVLLPVLVATLILFSGWTVSNQLAAGRQGDWVRATRGDIVSGVDISGTLASVVTEAFGPPQVEYIWDFKIAMLAPEGTDVKKGTPIAAFDTAELQKLLDQKNAERDEAGKQIEKKRADLSLRQRDEQLRLAESEARLRKASLKLEAPPDIVGLAERKASEIDFALATREVEASRARAASLRAAADAEIRLLESRHRQAAADVADAQDAIRRMTILAPRDGTVVYVPDWRGEKRKIGDTAWRGLKIVEIPDLKRMRADGEVDEVDAGRIRTGQRVAVKLDAHPDDTFHGRITAVARTVQQKQGTQNPLRALRVVIDLDRTDPAKMRPGMRFSGSVELTRARNATLIPLEALFSSDHGPVAYRRTIFGSEQVPLKLGLENREHVQVISGLSPGDRILIPRSADERRSEP